MNKESILIVVLGALLSGFSAFASKDRMTEEKVPAATPMAENPCATPTPEDDPE